VPLTLYVTLYVLRGTHHFSQRISASTHVQHTPYNISHIRSLPAAFQRSMLYLTTVIAGTLHPSEQYLTDSMPKRQTFAPISLHFRTFFRAICAFPNTPPTCPDMSADSYRLTSMAIGHLPYNTRITSGLFRITGAFPNTPPTCPDTSADTFRITSMAIGHLSYNIRVTSGLFSGRRSHRLPVWPQRSLPETTFHSSSDFFRHRLWSPATIGTKPQTILAPVLNFPYPSGTPLAIAVTSRHHFPIIVGLFPTTTMVTGHHRYQAAEHS
jgi:hypothetical protein